METELAFVVDALAVMGGAEKVLLAALEVFPRTPIYALVYDREQFTGSPIADSRVTASFIDRLPLAHRSYRNYLPLMPRAIEQLNLGRFERIVSFSYAAAHGVRTRPGQMHASYTHTPMRYAWRGVPLGGIFRRWPRLAEGLLESFRRWDVKAVSHIDRLGAISHYVASLVQTAYRREAQVIYPPVEVEKFRPLQRGDDYITVSRLVAHKRLDLIVSAFTALKLPLIVVGEGPERARLSKIAGPNVTFAGYQEDGVVAELLGRARAFVYASEEDFGIAIVEAQAAGCPVIALGKGGAVETVYDGITGVLYKEQSAGSLIEAVERFEGRAGCFDERRIVQNAQRFNKERFKEEFARFVYQDRQLPALKTTELAFNAAEMHSATGQSLPG